MPYSLLPIQISLNPKLGCGFCLAKMANDALVAPPGFAHRETAVLLGIE